MTSCHHITTNCRVESRHIISVTDSETSNCKQKTHLSRHDAHHTPLVFVVAILIEIFSTVSVVTQFSKQSTTQLLVRIDVVERE